MMNKISIIATLAFLAPYDVASGAGFQVGGVFAVATGAAASGEMVIGDVSGVFDLVKAGSQGWTVFQDKIYWDNTNKCCTTVATGNLFIGYAGSTVGNGATATTGRVIVCQPGFAPARSAHISDPTGGATADAESRAAIGSIIDALEKAGILAAS